MRGSTTAIIEPGGELIEGYEYDEFGNLQLTQNSGFLNETAYAGSISDTSTGLQYMNARFYQPATGRFISQDTYTGNAYDPWTQHLYAYTGNNPVNFVDPTGHMQEQTAGGGGGVFFYKYWYWGEENENDDERRVITFKTTEGTMKFFEDMYGEEEYVYGEPCTV